MASKHDSTFHLFFLSENFSTIKNFYFSKFETFILLEMNDHEKQMEEYVPTDKMNSLVLDYLITNGHTRKGLASVRKPEISINLGQ